MALDTKQLHEVGVWVNKRFPNGYSCPICQGTQFERDDLVEAPKSVTDPKILHSGAAPGPFLQTLCSGCGFVMYFNMGVDLPYIGPTGSSESE